MAVAFLFPGQGSQQPGMLHNLPAHPEVESTISEISAALNKDVLQLDTAQALTSTVAVQLCLYTAGVAVARALLSSNVAPHAVAGLSVGAFAAAVVSGSLSLVDGLTLVKQRAELMEQLFQTGYGMSAIVGLTEKQVSAVVNSISTAMSPVYVSNINAARQIVIAGTSAAMDQVLLQASALGASKAERLKVSVPSHCPLLAPVAKQLETSINAMRLNPPERIYVSNINARPLRTAAEIGIDLAHNIANAVRWYQANVLLSELGCSLFLEMNPGRVLTDLCSENVPDARAEALAFSTLKHAIRLDARDQAS